jgi:epoxyqueuosine reductase QueG
VADAAVGAALAPLAAAHAVYFPFDGAEPLIPFQRLGRAAGLGGPGPLGLQIHPTFGPWWAYRALVVVDRALPARAPIGDGCAGCDAPCVGACPAHAVARTGFLVAACHARRLEAEACRLSCAARIACVRGPEHRYTDAQLAFHMAASMPRRLPRA